MARTVFLFISFKHLKKYAAILLWVKLFLKEGTKKGFFWKINKAVDLQSWQKHNKSVIESSLYQVL